MNIILQSNLLFMILFSYCLHIGSCTESSDTEADVSEELVYNKSLALLKRDEILQQQQNETYIKSNLNPKADAWGNGFFGLNYKGMPIALANSLWWHCVKIIKHLIGRTPYVYTSEGRKTIRHINLDAIHLEVFSKIRIKKTDESLEFWVECKQNDHALVGRIPNNKPTGCWKYNPDKMRKVFELDHQLELIRKYLLNNGWTLIQRTQMEGGQWYEFHH